MKAARFWKKGKLIIEDIPIREPDAHEVLIRVRYCGVCGTDIHIYNGAKGAAEVTPPVTLGHEFSGYVLRVGDGVVDLKPGDRVSVDPNNYCGKCYFCTRGMKHLCRHMVGLGTSLDGGFAETITVDERLVHHIPDPLDYKAAAMAEPLSCCLHGIDLTDIRAGQTVMVVGTGSIGMMMVQLAKACGASAVIAVEPNAVHREKALKLGADFGIDPIHDDTRALLEQHAIENIDRVIDCAGLISTAEYCIRYAGRGAVVMLFGLTGPDDEMKLRPFEAFQKELTIKACFVNPDTFSRSVALLAAGVVRTEEIIDQVIPLSDIARVFEERLYAGGGKVLIDCGDELNEKSSTKP